MANWWPAPSEWIFASACQNRWFIFHVVNLLSHIKLTKLDVGGRSQSRLINTTTGPTLKVPAVISVACGVIHGLLNEVIISKYPGLSERIVCWLCLLKPLIYVSVLYSSAAIYTTSQGGRKKKLPGLSLSPTSHGEQHFICHLEHNEIKEMRGCHKRASFLPDSIPVTSLHYTQWWQRQLSPRGAWDQTLGCSNRQFVKEWDVKEQSWSHHPPQSTCRQGEHLTHRDVGNIQQTELQFGKRVRVSDSEHATRWEPQNWQPHQQHIQPHSCHIQLRADQGNLVWAWSSNIHYQMMRGIILMGNLN